MVTSEQDKEIPLLKGRRKDNHPLNMTIRICAPLPSSRGGTWYQSPGARRWNRQRAGDKTIPTLHHAASSRLKESQTGEREKRFTFGRRRHLMNSMLQDSPLQVMRNT